MKLLLIFSLFILIRPAMGQMGSDMLGSPSDMHSMAGRKMGGVSVALPDFIPNVPGNPANLIYLERRVVFFSITNSRTNTLLNEQLTRTKETIRWSNNETPGYCAASLPFKFMKRRWVAAASFNGKQWPAFDERYLSANRNIFSYELKKTGHIRSASIGLAAKLSEKYSVGIGWTKWFGGNNWHYGKERSGTADYSAQRWHLGFMGQIGGLSIGTVVYFPSQFVSGSNKTNSWNQPSSLQFSQNYNYDAKFGFAYRLLRRCTIAVGYSHQFPFEFHYAQQNRQNKVKYNKGKELSGGIEYQFTFAKIKMPIYFGYHAIWPPQGIGHIPYDFFEITRKTDRSFLKRYVFGTHLQYKNIGLYFDAQWMRDFYEIIERNVPPWS
ncbi:MAG: hypothetical protein GXO75_01675 [Calditrichaeota bacterium]|nr:hypothetical protein [Calditrichota bacterium]